VLDILKSKFCLQRRKIKLQVRVNREGFAACKAGLSGATATLGKRSSVHTTDPTDSEHHRRRTLILGEGGEEEKGDGGAGAEHEAQMTMVHHARSSAMASFPKSAADDDEGAADDDEDVVDDDEEEEEERSSANVAIRQPRKTFLGKAAAAVRKAGTMVAGLVDEFILDDDDDPMFNAGM
jgi:hypothetical protein